MAGLSDKGFEIKSLNRVIKDLREDAENSFADLVPDGDSVDTSDSTILGRLTKLVAPSLSDLWEAAQDVYTSFDPDSATGRSLDNLVKYSRISRRGDEKSSALVRLLAEVDTVIPSGSSLKSSNGESWVLNLPIEFDPYSKANGAVIKVELVAVGTVIKLDMNIEGVVYSVSYENQETTLVGIMGALVDAINVNSDTVVAETVGEDEISVIRVGDFNDTVFTTQNCEVTDLYKTSTARSASRDAVEAFAGDLNQIETPVLGWYSVTNPYDAIVGRAEETDSELRERFRESKFTLGSTSVDALYSKLVGVSGVTDIVIYENLSDSVDGYGVPAHAFSPVVLGGDASEIAQIIWENRPLGIPSHGNTEVTVTAVDGRPKIVEFERPTSIPLEIRVELVKEYDFPDNGVELIKNRIISYFRNNYRIGTNVNYSKLFIPINQVRGHHINLLQFAKVGETLGYDAVGVNFNEVVTITYENITIIAS